MINKVQIIGKVLQRPEFYYTKDKILIGDIIIQTYNSKLDIFDEFKISLVGTQASASKIISCKENDLIYVEGRLTSTYRTRKSDGFKFLDHRIVVNSVRFWDDGLTHAKSSGDFGISSFLLIGTIKKPLFFESFNEKNIAKIGVETFIPAKPNPIVDYAEITVPSSMVEKFEKLNANEVVTISGNLNGTAVQGHNVVFYNLRASAFNAESTELYFDYPIDQSL